MQATFWNAVSWMKLFENFIEICSLCLFGDISILVRVIVCCQATHHYLNQCWQSSMTPYFVIRPKWVLKKIKRSIFGEKVYSWVDESKLLGFCLQPIVSIWPAKHITSRFEGTRSIWARNLSGNSALGIRQRSWRVFSRLQTCH